MLKLFSLLAGSVVLMMAVPAQAQYGDFQINGVVHGPNLDTTSGPYGCQSRYIDIKEWRPVCPGDRVATLQSRFMTAVWELCGRDELGSQCIGGFVEVPGSRFYRIVNSYDQPGQYEVRVTDIYTLGNCITIVRNSDSNWGRYARYHAQMFVPYNRQDHYTTLSSSACSRVNGGY